MNDGSHNNYIMVYIHLVQWCVIETTCTIPYQCEGLLLVELEMLVIEEGGKLHPSFQTPEQ